MPYNEARSSEALGVVDPKWEEVPPTPVSLRSSHLSDIPFTVLRMFTGREMLSHDSQTPSTLLSQGYAPDATLPDLKTAIEYRDAFRIARRGLLSGGPAAEAAADELLKAIPEYGWYGGWCLPPPGLVTDPQAVRAVPNEVWAMLRASLSAEELASRPPLTVKEGTNHGAPTWRSTLPDHIAHFGLARLITDGRSLEATFKKAYGILGWDVPPTPVLTMLTRTGPLRKAVPVHDWRGDTLHHVANATGFFCRRRQVRTVPTCFNEALRPVIMALTRAFKAGSLSRWFKHGSAAYNNASIYRSLERARAFDPAARFISDDASNFDDSVNIRHLEDLYSKCYVTSDGERELLLALTTAPLLSGPTKRPYKAALYPRRGTVPSGTISTSLDDSVINAAVALCCVASACGWSVTDAIRRLERGEWDLRTQGDDTGLIVPSHFDIERYTSTAAEFGFKRTPTELPVFLKTFHASRGHFYNFSARALVRSAWRERRANGPCHELLGAAIRWELCLRDPLFPYHWKWYANTNRLAREFGVRTFPDFRRVVDDDKFVRTLTAERSGPQGERNWQLQLEAIGFDLVGRDAADELTDETDDDDLKAFGPLAAIALDRLGGLRSFLSLRRSTASLLDGSFDPWVYLREIASRERL